MQIVTLNIEGFFRNFYYLCQVINIFTPKILFLQEIWVPYCEESALSSKIKDYTAQISTPDQFIPTEDMLNSVSHTWHGAAIMWHSSLNSNVSNLKNVHDRFTGVKISLPDRTLLAISAYLPTSGKDDEYLDCVAILSNFIMDNCCDIVLIGGDFNCSDKASPRRITALQSLCITLNLHKVHPSEPTFHHPNSQSSSCIDYFLLSYREGVSLNNIFLQCSQETPENLSGHDPVLATLSVQCTQPSKNTARQELYTHTYTEFDRPKVAWDENNL